MDFLKKIGVFVTISVVAVLSVSAQNPYIHHYTTFDGLPTNVINGVFQDSRKFIWFATDAGAVRYDGSVFITFTKKDGLNSNKITKIKEDSSGRIWIFNYVGSMNFYFHNKIYNSSNAAYLDSLKPGEAFHDFFEDDDRTIYFHNPMYEVFSLDSNIRVRKFDNLIGYLEENLETPDGQKATGPYPRDYTASFPNFILANLYQIRKNSAGQYFFWTKFGLVKVGELFRDPILLGYNRRCFLRASCEKDSNFYILALGKYIKEYLGCESGKMVQLPGDIYIGYTMARQNALLVDRQGRYWVGTFDEGVYCYEQDTVIRQKTGPDIPEIRSSRLIRHLDINRVDGLIQDHEGNIWVSSSVDGVYKISAFLNEHHHYNSELFGNKGIIDLAPGLWKGVWLSSGKNVFLLKDNILYNLDYQVDYISMFNSLYQLKNNKLILGEKYSDFFILHDPKPDIISNKVLFRSADTSILYMSGLTVNEKEDKINCFNYFNFDLIDPDTLFGEYASGYGSWQKDFNVGSRITNTYYNNNDELVINAKKNYILEGDTFRYAPELSQFDNKIITQHINLNSETELFNLDNESIFLLHEHKFFNLSEAFSTPSDLNITSIAWHDPVLYMASASNIYYCDNLLDLINDHPVTLNLTDLNFKNIHKILAQDSALYIASDDGLTVIPETAIHEIVPQIPLPFIQTVLVNDEPADISDGYLRASGRVSLKFIFGSISYSSTPVLFSYTLEGADNNWSSGTGNIVNYRKMPFGNYTFRLKTGKPNMAWSEPISLQIRIKPKFWQHPAFFVFIILVILTVIAFYLYKRANDRFKQREIDHQLILLEQKALQSMMNPHFIFNTLGSIQSFLLENKPDEAGLYLSQFARLIRLNINSLNSNLIELEEEINRLKIYLELEKFRLENKFDYKMELEGSLTEDDIYIPSMIIQPYIENAVWHGISPLEGQGEIKISFSLNTSETLKIIIEDNGIGMKQSAKYSSKGEQHLHLSMEIIRKRLEIIGMKTKVKTSVTITEAYPGKNNPGTKVEIVMPVSYGSR